MEQRRLRLGDILDDYCPRERRVTNHAIVAMIEDDVKQTRCTTCDAEHVYKGGHSPRKRRKDAGTALYQEVLAGMPEAAEVSTQRPAPPAPLPVSPPVLEAAVDSAAAIPEEAVRPVAPLIPDPADEEPAPGDDRENDGPGVDDGPIHRRLIRATLPRPEGQKEVRQATDFTIRPNGNRPGGGFRGDRMRGQGGSGGGSGMRTGGRRFGGGNQPGGAGGARNGSGRNRPGFGGGGNGNGRGPSGNPGRPQGGRKRSR